MNQFINLTVAYAVGKTRTELINMSKVYRIIEREGGVLLCFNSSGSDHIEVKETKADIEKLLG